MSNTGDIVAYVKSHKNGAQVFTLGIGKYPYERREEVGGRGRGKEIINLSLFQEMGAADI